MCHFQTHALQQNVISLVSKIETSIDLEPRKCSLQAIGPPIEIIADVEPAAPSVNAGVITRYCVIYERPSVSEIQLWCLRTKCSFCPQT
jgi:hypothetical protein